MNSNDSNFIHAICDEFEEAWAAGERPSVQEFLGRVAGTQRAQLLRELLKIDCEYRLKVEPDTSAIVYAELGESAVSIADRILDQHRDAPTIIGQQVLGDSAAPRQPKTIDQFELIEPIGEGGMGSVWLAQQRKPDRKVALKVISNGVDTKEARARFDGERQALAMLDHPHIAKVYGGGTTQHGSPYFVMELVDGVPLTQHCDENQLGVRQRLQVMVDVCDAIRHAHQRGIIHRDLKPSNVLVTCADKVGKDKETDKGETDKGETDKGDADKSGTPKVIDFGLAKSIERTQKLTEQTLNTEFGRVLGTLRYMSPEQAELDSQDIDTRTDVYSLGVILYELLTGSTPLNVETVKQNKLLETLEIIRKTEPPRPSSLLSSASHDAAQLIGCDRRIAPFQLEQILKGELDWIVMKAIEKDRGRRYESVAHLSDDIRRFLNGEAVLAKPPSLTYLASKTIAKHRTLFGIGAVSALLLIMAAGIATAFALWAMDEAKLAKEEGARADREKQNAIQLAEEADFQAKKAKQSAAQARESAEVANEAAKRAKDMLGVLTGAFRSPDPSKGGTKDMSAEDVLDVAAEMIEEKLSDDPKAKAELLKALSNSYRGLGKYLKSIEISDQVSRISDKHFGADSVEALEAQGELAGVMNLAGDHQNAIPIYQFALDQAKLNYGEGSFIAMKLQADLAACWIAAGKSEDAIKSYEELLAMKRGEFDEATDEVNSTKHNLAVAYSDFGKHEKALQLHREVLKYHESTNPEGHPDILNSMNSLAISLEMTEEYEEALMMKERVLKLYQESLRENHPSIAISMNNLAHGYANMERWEDAIDTGLKAVETMRLAFPENHPYTLKSINSLAGFYRDSGKYEEAIPYYLEALQIREDTLGEQHPATVGSYKGVGLCYKRFRKYDKAVEYYLKGLELAKGAYRENHPEIAAFWGNVAYAYRDGKQLEKAIAAFEECIAIRKIELGPEHKDTMVVLNRLADVYLRAMKPQEAVPVLEELLEIQEGIPNFDPSYITETYRWLHIAYACLEDDANLERATAAWIRTIESERKLRPNTRHWARVSHAASLVDQGKFEQANAILEKASSFSNKDLTTFARLQNIKALCLAERGELADAVALAKESQAKLDIKFLENSWSYNFVYATNACRRTIEVLKMAGLDDEAEVYDTKLKALEEWIEKEVSKIK